LREAARSPGAPRLARIGGLREAARSPGAPRLVRIGGLREAARSPGAPRLARIGGLREAGAEPRRPAARTLSCLACGAPEARGSYAFLFGLRGPGGPRLAGIGGLREAGAEPGHQADFRSVYAGPWRASPFHAKHSAMSLSRLVPVLVAVLLTLTTAAAGAAPKPVKGAVLFRVDASAGPGTYQLHVSNSGGEEADHFALALGPRLGLNLGYGVSRLIRIGLNGSAAFSLNLAEDEGIPSAEVDGWARWNIGPSVGFRFGPKVPIELDVAVQFANFQSLGSQTSIGGMLSFDALAKQYGMTSTVLLLWRPGGAKDEFALHAGLEGTWGLSSSTPAGSSTESQQAMFLQSLLVGISFGL